MSESPRSPGAPQRQSGVPVNETQKDKIQRQLDEALDASFPASDPVAIVTSNEEEDWGQPESK
jgi:hypothetical protein